MFWNILTIFVTIYILIWKGLGVYDPMKGKSCVDKSGVVVFKNIPNICYCLTIAVGIEMSKKASYDWGQGGCPKDGLMEQEMDDVNEDFRDSMQSFITGLAVELVFIEVLDWYEDWREKRARAQAGRGNGSSDNFDRNAMGETGEEGKPAHSGVDLAEQQPRL